MIRILTLCIAGLLASSSFAQAIDLDEDGLGDDIEEMLIDRYRPHYYFDANEHNWPASVKWYVERCQLLWNGHLIFSNNDLSGDPLRILHGGSITGAPSNACECPQQSAYILDPVTGVANGEGPFPVGTYAHAVPMNSSVFYQGREGVPVGAPGDIAIQYWQFFPYNDSQAPSCCAPLCGPCDPFDHDGDWLYLDVIVQGSPPFALKQIVYHHHGDGNCTVDILPGQYALPPDGIPKCYLEEGNHEWWPLPNVSDCFGADPHRGNGVNFRTEGIINLGERCKPSPDPEAQLVILFNGKWGEYGGAFTTPADSPLHQSPPGFFNAPNHAPQTCVTVTVTWVDFAYSGFEDGSISRPFNTFLEATNAVPIGGLIRFRPGSRAEAITVSKAMTLEAPLGTVTIGR